MAHITGGGLPGNLHRALPPTVDAVVETASWTVPNEFQVLQRAGDVPRDEMFRAFNMGVGMVVISEPRSADAIMGSARSVGIEAWILGQTVPGAGQVKLV